MRPFRVLIMFLLCLTALSAAGLPALKELGAARQLAIGTAVKAKALASDAEYQATLLRHFSLVTPENEMKWKHLRPAQDRWAFDEADQIVAFAERNALRVRGHTLVWIVDQHAPAWQLKMPRTPEVAERMMREHIGAVMGRYRGRVMEWDVVNEAISNDNRAGASPYAKGYWFDAIGDSYIAAAFRLAREVDPAARLFYNDYDHGLASGPKSDRIYALLKKLRAEGAPIDGVGLQMHCNIAKPPVKEDMIRNFRRLAALGLRVEVTELDVEIMTASGSMDHRLAKQAEVYRDVFSAAVESGCVEAVVTWGFTDKFRQGGILERKGLPAQETPMWLFDAAFRPKPALHAVVDTLSASNQSSAYP